MIKDNRPASNTIIPIKADNANNTLTVKEEVTNKTSEVKQEGVKNAEQRIIGVPFTKDNPGRPKGSKNKYTRLRDDILSVFKKLGGSKAMAKWAATHQKDFYTIMAGLLPKQIEPPGDGEGIQILLIRPNDSNKT